MKTKLYILAASLCCMLPFMAQGADLDDIDPPTPPPRAQLRSIPNASIAVETASGMLILYFKSDFGKINVSLQEATGATEENLLVDTSIRNRIEWFAPAGSYILTITDTNGNVIKHDIVDIP